MIAVEQVSPERSASDGPVTPSDGIPDSGFCRAAFKPTRAQSIAESLVRKRFPELTSDAEPKPAASIALHSACGKTSETSTNPGRD